MFVLFRYNKRTDHAGSGSEWSQLFVKRLGLVLLVPRHHTRSRKLMDLLWGWQPPLKKSEKSSNRSGQKNRGNCWTHRPPCSFRDVRKSAGHLYVTVTQEVELPVCADVFMIKMFSYWIYVFVVWKSAFRGLQCNVFLISHWRRSCDRWFQWRGH